MKSKNTIATRNTRQKDAIRAAFVETDRPLSPEEVLSYAQRAVADVSIATVYRNLKTLVDDGWLAPVQLPGEPARYELSGKEHHHHFLSTTVERSTNSKDAYRRSSQSCLVDSAPSVMIFFFTASARRVSQGTRNEQIALPGKGIVR
jgi:Fe2+ or Zn2+ uptake regulation protein